MFHPKGLHQLYTWRLLRIINNLLMFCTKLHSTKTKLSAESYASTNWFSHHFDLEQGDQWFSV